jgi:hypothetical protein
MRALWLRSGARQACRRPSKRSGARTGAAFLPVWPLRAPMPPNCIACMPIEGSAPVSVSASLSRARCAARSWRPRRVSNPGSPFLPRWGSTAPFIGLFGTVWGIYHALVGLSGATQVVLDKVAGPVGEALIMTAAGLFVAIPAVLAYNACARGNRLTLARLDGFAHDLHAYLTTGLRGRPGDKLVDLGAVRVSRSGLKRGGRWLLVHSTTAAPVQPMAEINTDAAGRRHAGVCW